MPGLQPTREAPPTTADRPRLQLTAPETHQRSSSAQQRSDCVPGQEPRIGPVRWALQPRLAITSHALCSANQWMSLSTDSSGYVATSTGSSGADAGCGRRGPASAVRSAWRGRCAAVRSASSGQRGAASAGCCAAGAVRPARCGWCAAVRAASSGQRGAASAGCCAAGAVRPAWRGRCAAVRAASSGQRGAASAGCLCGRCGTVGVARPVPGAAGAVRCGRRQGCRGGWPAQAAVRTLGQPADPARWLSPAPAW
jgi:hypothetical protein